MKIGIDAGTISVPDDRLKVGVYRVAYNLVNELKRLDSGNEYLLYSFTTLESPLMSGLGNNFVNIVLKPAKAWMKLRVAFELSLRPVDVFLALGQACPTGVKNVVGFVYDLGFLHNPGAYGSAATRLRRQTDYLISQSSRIVTISDFTKQDINKFYGKSTQVIKVCYPGVDDRFTAAGEKKHWEVPYILFVGSLNKAKNLPFALEGFARFLKSSSKPQDFILIGGEYWKDDEIEKCITKYSLQERVKRIGYIADSELPSYYRGAVAAVSPGKWEGFCLPAAEAMACGCPVVGADTGAFSEVAGDAGLTFSSEDSASFAYVLEKVITGKSLRLKMREAGIRRSKEFRWELFAKSVMSIIRYYEHQAD